MYYAVMSCIYGSCCLNLSHARTYQLCFLKAKKQGRGGLFIYLTETLFSISVDRYIFIFLTSGALRENAKIMDVHVLMEVGAGGQATPHVLSPVEVGYSIEKERVLTQGKSVNSFTLLNL